MNMVKAAAQTPLLPSINDIFICPQNSTRLISRNALTSFTNSPSVINPLTPPQRFLQIICNYANPKDYHDQSDPNNWAPPQSTSLEHPKAPEPEAHTSVYSPANPQTRKVIKPLALGKILLPTR